MRSRAAERLLQTIRMAGPVRFIPEPKPYQPNTVYISYRHGVQKKKKQILTAHLLYSLFVYKCAGQRSMTLNYVNAYCLFFLVLKFCADRKKAKLKVGTLAIWEAFFEANVTNNDNKTGNVQYLAQMLSILDHEM